MQTSPLKSKYGRRNDEFREIENMFAESEPADEIIAADDRCTEGTTEALGDTDYSC